MVEELKSKNEKIEDHLQEIKAKGNNELAILRKQNEELKINNDEVKTKYENLKTEIEDMKTEDENLKTKLEEVKTENGNLKAELVEMKSKNEDLKYKNEDLKSKNEATMDKNEKLKTSVENLEDEIEVETRTSRQCQSENVSNIKLIQELKASQSEMSSDLENCKTTDADLLISKEELKECLEELDAEMKKNLQWEITTTSTTTTTTPPSTAVLVLNTWSSSNKPMVVSFEGQ